MRTVDGKVVAAAAALLAWCWGVYVGSDSFVVTEAEAAQAHLPSIEREIEALELERIRVLHRPDLSDQVKREYLARIDVRLETTRLQRDCLRKNRINCD